MEKLKAIITTSVLGGAGCLITLFVLSLSGIIGAFCFPYVINTWLVYAGHAPVFLWYWGFVLGYVPFIGQFSLPLAAITFVITLFM